MMREIITLSSLILLTACSAVTGTAEKDLLLPNDGRATADIMQGKKTVKNYYGNGVRADYTGEALMPTYQSQSTYTNKHIRELQRDFKRVPNPEIIGYVYPHISDNRMPVPGYFTTFPLYERSHFALSSEGHNE